MRRTACIGFLACGLAVVASARSVAQVPGPRARSDRAVRSFGRRPRAAARRPGRDEDPADPGPGDGRVRRGPDSRRQGAARPLDPGHRRLQEGRRSRALPQDRLPAGDQRLRGAGARLRGAPGPRALQARRLRAPARGSGDRAIPDRGGLGRARCGPAGEPADAPAPPGLRGGLPPRRRRRPRRGPQRADAAARRGRLPGADPERHEPLRAGPVARRVPRALPGAVDRAGRGVPLLGEGGPRHGALDHASPPGDPAGSGWQRLHRQQAALREPLHRHLDAHAVAGVAARRPRDTTSWRACAADRPCSRTSRRACSEAGSRRNHARTSRSTWTGYGRA